MEPIYKEGLLLDIFDVEDPEAATKLVGVRNEIRRAVRKQCIKCESFRPNSHKALEGNLKENTLEIKILSGECERSEVLDLASTSSGAKNFIAETPAPHYLFRRF